jgi:hypothetical protein
MGEQNLKLPFQLPLTFSSHADAHQHMHHSPDIASQMCHNITPFNAKYDSETQISRDLAHKNNVNHHSLPDKLF